MVEYSDFECSFCGRFARETMPSLVKRYVDTGQLLIVFRHLPIEGIHRFALRAAEAANCAGTAGRFWEMHDALFLNHTRLDEGSLREHAGTVGLDPASFGKCLSEADGSKVQQDVAEAKALGIKVTPTFLIGLKVSEHEMKAALRLDGARPLAEFVEALDRATRPASGRQP
jgi:protein-disulfide isomerase